MRPGTEWGNTAGASRHPRLKLVRTLERNSTQNYLFGFIRVPKVDKVMPVLQIKQ